MKPYQPFLMREGVQERRDRGLADCGQGAGHFFPHGFHFILQQRNERGYGSGILNTSQRFGRVHAHDPIVTLQRTHQRLEDAPVGTFA